MFEYTNLDLEFKKIIVDDIIFLLNPRTLSLFEVDAVTAAIVDLCGKNSGEEILAKLAPIHGEQPVREALQELVHLHEASPLKDTIQEAQIRGIALVITESCILRCKYCFRSDPRRNSRMSEEIALQAVDFLIKHSPAEEGLSIHFTGGEPLLYSELIKAVIEYTERVTNEIGRKIKFIITTNGILLTKEIVDYFAKHKISVNVSIDGLPEAHDRYRCFPDGQGSHKYAVAGLMNLIHALPMNDIAVNMVVTHETISCLKASYSYLRSLVESTRIKITILPVVASDPTLMLTREDLVQLAEFYESVYRLGSLWNPFASYPYRYWQIGVTLGKKKHRCRAGYIAVCVSPGGFLYPCEQLASRNYYSLGHVTSGFDPHKKSIWQRARASVDDSPKCSKCWARYYCGGGCYYRALEENNDPLIPSEADCLERQIVLEAALRCKLRLMLRQRKGSVDEESQMHLSREIGGSSNEC